LDECDITLRELDMVAESFVKTLLGMQHHRISYPGYDFNKVPTKAAKNIETNQQIGDAVPIPTIIEGQAKAAEGD
jgi:hypothetical protein